jgi:hypothetical protein
MNIPYLLDVKARDAVSATYGSSLRYQTKAKLREMLAEAVRNTAQPKPKPPTKAKRDRPKKAA